MSETPTKPRRRKRNRSPLPPIEVTPEVTLEQVRTLWEAIMADPMPYYLSDYTPRVFHELVQQLGRTVLLVIGKVGGELAGGIFITQSQSYPTTARPLHAMIDLYVMAPYRGRAALVLARAWRDYLLNVMRLPNFYAMIDPRHKASQTLVTQAGMTRCGLIPRYIPRNGIAEDMLVYSMVPPRPIEEEPHG